MLTEENLLNKQKDEDNISLILFRLNKLEEEEKRYHEEHMKRMDILQQTITDQTKILVSHDDQLSYLEEKIKKIEDVNSELDVHETRISNLETHRTLLIGAVITVITMLIANIILRAL